MWSFEIAWWMLALFYLCLVVLYFGIGAMLNFFFTCLTLRPLTKVDDEEIYSRSTAFGFALLGGLAGGVPNFLVAWIRYRYVSRPRGRGTSS